MSEADIRGWRGDLALGLADWQEPDGLLIFSEPDPEVRDRCRDRLRVAVEVLDRVLGDGGRARATGLRRL
jgi:hypothetical protein